MCDTRRDLKKVKTTAVGEEAYRDISNKIKKSMNKAKEDWIEKQCTEVEESLSKNNSKKDDQIMKDLTRQKQSRVNTIQDKNGNCLTEDKDIISRWTEHCSEMYNHQTDDDRNVLISQDLSNEDNFLIL